MAVRKSKEEHFEIKGEVSDVVNKCFDALRFGGFKNIKVNSAISQITADYHELSTWGNIQITVTAGDSAYSKVHVLSTANADNIYALFSSPNKKILEAFKSNIR